MSQPLPPVTEIFDCEKWAELSEGSPRLRQSHCLLLLVRSRCAGCFAAGKQDCVAVALEVDTLVVAAPSDKFGN